MFRDDFEFHDGAAPSHLGAQADAGRRARRPRRDANADPAAPIVWAPDAEKELKKIPFFVRGKARRNTETLRADATGLPPITVETLVRCQSAFQPLTRRRCASSSSRWTAIWRARPSARATRCGASCRASTLAVHAADEWGGDADALARCRADIARGDIVIATMLFLDEHIRAVLPALAARRDQCDAMVCCLSAGEVVQLTRIGSFDMAARRSGVDGAAEAPARQRQGRRKRAARAR